jgi:hypothetical protein
MLPELCVGYQFRDPGSPPRSHILNLPPVPTKGRDLQQDMADWRSAVMQHEAQLATVHSTEPVWFPVYKAAHHHVVPVMGGTPSSWDSLITNLTIAAIDNQFDNVMIAKLSQWRVLESLRTIGKNATRANLRFDTVSASGSTSDLFTSPEPADLAGFIVDAIRVLSDAQGRRDSAREKADLVAVAALLDAPVSLAKLAAALDLALGALNPSTPSNLSKTEERKLRDFHHNVVSQRRQTADRLDGLHADLRELQGYGRSPRKVPLQLGSGPVRVRSLEIDSAQAIHEYETARGLVSSLVAHWFAKDSTQATRRDLLIVAGADKLATEVLESLKDSAQQLGKQLVLLFAEITQAARRSIGAGGGDYAVFMRLPNADDAEVASRQFGKEFTFVVNGISIAEGKTQEWSSAYGRTSTSGNSRTSNFGLGFGGSITRSFGYSNTDTETKGGGTSHVQTTNTSRVHEFRIEPEEFQHLEEHAMLVVEGKHVTYTSCDYRLRNGRNTSRQALALPPGSP